MAEAQARPRRGRTRLWAYAASAALIAGGGFYLLGPAAPGLIDQMADGQRVWRLGRIQVDGVSGAWLGALRAERVTIADDDGVWIEARNVALNWRPQDILFGGVTLEAARADAIHVLRQPALSEPRPSGNARFHLRIADLGVDEITLEEAVLGEAARFSADLKLNLYRRDLRELDVALRRLDSDADRAFIIYRPDRDYVLDADIVSAPGGILARALGVGDEGLHASAEGDGDPQTGEARYSAAVGARQVLEGAAAWTPGAWRLDAEADLTTLPQLEDIARRLGPRLTLAASGARVGDFTARLASPFLTADISGELDEARQLVGPARVVATTARLSDIARESPFELGAGRLEGELRRARGTIAIRATLTGQDADALGQRTQFSGPVSAALTDDGFTAEADLRAPENAPALFARARLRASLNYDRERARFALERASLEGDALNADARGWAGHGDGEFSGAWRVRQLNAFAGDLTGGAGGRWRAFAAPIRGATERIWTVTVQGAGAGIGGAPDIVPQLLGAAPTLDAMLRAENGGLTVAHARVQGARLRAGASGRIIGGESNLAFEASARGPISLGGAQMDGAIDATGRITGRIARPTLSAQTVMSSFSAGGVTIMQPQVTFTLAPHGDTYSGRVEAEGQINGQPAHASAIMAYSERAAELRDLDAQIGAMSARGLARVTGRGVEAELAVDGALDGLAPGVRGRLVGDLTLTPDAMSLDAALSDFRAGDLYARAATLNARGPLDAIAAEFNMRGRLRQAPLAFAGTGTLNARASTLRIDGRGQLADADIFTRAPITANWGGQSLEATLNVALGDGVVSGAWRERGRTLSGEAQVEDAPLGPLAAIWGERATGRIDGSLTLANAGRGLAGAADLTFNDARFAGRQRGQLDMRVEARLEPSRLTATIDARSDEGLVARFAADAPVVTDAEPILIALAPERRGRATWSVRGPAASIWSAARLADQSLDGRLDGEGALEFGAGHLSGEGFLQIAQGRFEDKLTGIVLANLDARIAIGDNGVQIERFTASGPRGGRMTATGGSANTREGRIVVTVDDMRVADRPEANARASGELTLSWEGLRSRFSGELNILEANIDIAGHAEAGIPTIEVIEINRPGMEDEPIGEAPAPRNGATELDVRVRAPGRVYTRGRGLDAEWALDLRLAGTARKPQVFGTARAVRGSLALSGQPFDIQEARINFDGDPLGASIDLTAQRDTADLSAIIRLTGTARDPEISFSSNPALPEDEILPQILFGRAVEDLSPFEAAQLAASLAALSGNATLDLVGAARAATGLDRFAVRQDEDGGVLVAGGAYLTRDVYVEIARTGMGQAQTQVEWTVRPRLVLITSFLGNGDQRVSLRWRRETD